MNFKLVIGLFVALLCTGIDALDVVCNSDDVAVTMTSADDTHLELDTSIDDNNTAISAGPVTLAAFAGKPANCKGTGTSQSFAFPLDECEPDIAAVAGEIIYTWYLRKVLLNNTGVLVERFRNIFISFQCKYTQTVTVFDTFLPTVAEKEISTMADGQYSFAMNFFSNSERTLALGATVIVPNLIYGKITLEGITDGGVVVAQVQKCWGSKTTMAENDDYVFVDNYCAQRGDPSDPIDVAFVSKQGNGSDAEFQFQSFTWGSVRFPTTDIFIWCTARACDSVVETCNPVCPGISKRDIGQDENTQLLSYGPFTVMPPPSDCGVANGGCDDVCAQEGDYAVCSCGNGATLAEDGETCNQEIVIDVQQHEDIFYVDATKIAGLMILLIVAIAATAMITMSCKRSRGKNVFQSV